MAQSRPTTVGWLPLLVAGWPPLLAGGSMRPAPFGPLAECRGLATRVVTLAPGGGVNRKVERAGAPNLMDEKPKSNAAAA